MAGYNHPPSTNAHCVFLLNPTHSPLWSFYHGACKDPARECVGLEIQESSGENRTCSSSGAFSNPRPGQGFAHVASASPRDVAGMALVWGLTPFMLMTPPAE